MSETASLLIKKSFNDWNIKDLKTELRRFSVKFRANSRKQDLLDLLHNTYFNIKYGDSNEHYVRHVITIQKMYRGWKTRCQLQDQGPGYYDRSKCNNTEDPITLCSVMDIPNAYFFSYRADDGRIYGFDIRSFKEMLNHKQIKNPFNRELYPPNVISTCNRLCRKLETFTNSESHQDKIDIPTRAFGVFHDIYLITGNFADQNWFLGLNRHELSDMYRHMWDIWHGIPQATKRRLCPQRRMFNQVEDVCLNHSFNLNKMQSLLINEFEYLISRPCDDSDKTICCMWILISMTRVSADAAMSLPHLIL